MARIYHTWHGYAAGAGLQDDLTYWWQLDAADASIVDLVNSVSLTKVGSITTLATGAPDGSACIQMGASGLNYYNTSIGRLNAYATGFSLNFWEYTDSFSSIGNWLVTHRANSGTNLYYQTLRSVAFNSRAVFWEFSPGGVVVAEIADTSTGAWKMWTMVRDGNILRWYRNAVEVDNAPITGAVGTDSPTPFQIGAFSPTGVNSAHRGRMWTVGLWSKTLTPAEITTLYNSGLGRKFNDL